MYFDNKIVIGDADGTKVFIEPKMANRHGLIAGATGTGKTITLKVLAESFSSMGVPVFLADVKGDLASLSKAGTDSEDMKARIERFGLAEMGFDYKKFPCTFWDIYAKGGIPLRTTISEMGPILLSKLMDLNDTQTELLNVVFTIADKEQLLLIDTKDLKAMLNYVAENADEYESSYGNIPKQSMNTILRAVVSLESQGAEDFFMEPALSIADWFTTDNGMGMINILDSRELMQNTTMYATFLLWMMSELFETLPEVGDLDKPRMVFFFDEAHLLFKDVPKAFKDKLEQVIKLIRSKGVGIYFITQSPKDIPDEILAQLGNKIQHALRAYTPAEQKAVKAAADSFRANPDFDTEEVLLNMGTGEALISVLDADGIPGIVQKCKVLPPQSAFGSIAEEERQQLININNLYLKYKEMYDRDSAYEFLTRQQKLDDEAEQKAKEEAEAEKLAEKEAEKAEKEAAKAAEKAEKEAQKAAEKAERDAQKAAEKAEKEAQKAAEKKQKAIKSGIRQVGQSAAGTIGRQVGKSLGKSVGGSFGKTLGGNVGAQLGRSILGTFLK